MISISGAYTNARWRIHWGGVVAICVVLFMAVAASVAAFEFGSLKNALMHLNGHKFIVDPPQLIRGTESDFKTRDMEFTITNLVGDELVISGVRSSCGCIQVPELPLTVPSRSSRSIRLRRGTPEKRRAEAVMFYVDIDGVRHSFQVAIPSE